MADNDRRKKREQTLSVSLLSQRPKITRQSGFHKGQLGVLKREFCESIALPLPMERVKQTNKKKKTNLNQTKKKRETKKPHQTPAKQNRYLQLFN